MVVTSYNSSFLRVKALGYRANDTLLLQCAELEETEMPSTALKKDNASFASRQMQALGEQN